VAFDSYKGKNVQQNPATYASGMMFLVLTCLESNIFKFKCLSLGATALAQPVSGMMFLVLTCTESNVFKFKCLSLGAAALAQQARPKSRLAGSHPWTIGKVNFMRQHAENVFPVQRECKILPKAEQCRTRGRRFRRHLKRKMLPLSHGSAIIRGRLERSTLHVSTQKTFFQCKESAKSSQKRNSVEPGADDFVGT
jgi:hypothetical protein